MRKPLLVALSVTMFVALFFPRAAAGQAMSTRSWPTQVLIGFSLAQMKLDHPGDLSNNGRTGLSAGISLGFPITPKESAFGLRTQALISQRGATIANDVVQEKFKMSYVDVMGLLEFRISPRINGDRITLLVGPTVHFTTSAQAVVNTTPIDIGDVTENYDYGFYVGAEFTAIPKWATVQVGWLPGLRQIFKEGSTTNNARNQTLMILISPKLIR